MRPGKLYFGDNLDVLRSGDFRDESIDLVYLDPPFNSNRAYNLIFKEQDLSPSRAQIHAFEDCWHWDQDAQSTYEELTDAGAAAAGVPPALSIILRALYDALPKRNDMLAYLVMMAPRLIELRRVLKSTGSIYLHCDPSASHYLKLVLDAIFGPANFVNEIIWKRSSAHSDGRQGAKHFGRISDTILFYSKSERRKFNPQYLPYDEKYVERDYRRIEKGSGRRYRLSDLSGPGGAAKGNPYYEIMGVTRHWRYTKEKMEQLIAQGRVVQTRPGAVPQYKRYLDEMPGVPLQNIWTDIDVINNRSKEKIGYPTQKPIALLERILLASTDEGDVVLDPFCGCGTSIEAAQRLHREWIGIDITHLAIKVVRERMAEKYPGIQYDLLGEPQDVESARVLAETSPYQFQWWAVHRIGAHPVGGEPGRREGRRGADRGVDGFLKFKSGNAVQEIVVSVKAGRHISPAMVRELRGTMERQRAAIGVLLTMQEPTAEMRREAVAAGFFRSGGAKFPKLQILSARDLFDGKTVRYPAGEPVKQEANRSQALLPGMEQLPPPPRKGVHIKVPTTPPPPPTDLRRDRTAASVDEPLHEKVTRRGRKG